MFLLRSGLIMPYNILNYLVGVTSLSVRDNALGYIGLIPVAIFEVYMGSQIDKISEITEAGGWTKNRTTIIFLIIGVVLCFCGVALISYFAKKEFDKMVKEAEEEEKRNERIKTVNIEADEDSRK